ncbi:receptor-transporting protein 3-like protein, partial [Lates japonicus]
MAHAEWTHIFQNEANNLLHGDTWHLEFNSSIEPEQPEYGWKEYIRNTSARFQCTQCRRIWPSNLVKVVFHMRLMGRRGTVKVRPMRQNCKICLDAPMEDPSIMSDHIPTLLRNLVKKIRIKCYNENLGEGNSHFEGTDVRSPHEPDFCEGSPCSALTINCSEPNQPALLKALTPVFNLNAIRPVMNMSTCTEIATYFTLYGILGVWWMNEFVHWDSAECGTHKIALPRDKFWTPDIVINE